MKEDAMAGKPPAKSSKPKTGTRKAHAKPPSRKRDAEPKLLSGGNPQIAKGTGDSPVQAYIAAMPGWKRDVGRRLDALIARAVPDVRKAVKWNSPFYGIEDGNWFLSFHCFAKYIKVASSAARRSNQSRWARPSILKCAISTSTRTNSTRRSSPSGSSRRASCRVSGCDSKPTRNPSHGYW